ncbi:hypothetical protein J2S10_004212 [Neobacillus ginsengisoli]|uniref:Uncharacterized protein n=1 Tax=Neobacillus ginsengisoli TaxID=904295 RepID=A0ABT9XZK3_9BACI|nr:hypothetical protein [Neobacillus ginsengisoli]
MLFISVLTYKSDLEGLGAGAGSFSKCINHINLSSAFLQSFLDPKKWRNREEH